MRNRIRTVFSTEMCVTGGTLAPSDAWKERERERGVVAFSAAARAFVKAPFASC